MLMDDRQITLNDLSNQCRESADIYRHEAERFDDNHPNLANLFRQIAERRDAIAEHCDQAVRESGALPKAVDLDRELLDETLERIGAGFSPDEITALVLARANSDEELLEQLNAIKECDLPDQIRDWLLAQRDEVSADLERLLSAV